MNNNENIRKCFREPIPQISQAAQYLEEAVSAYFAGQMEEAGRLIRLADMPAIREWTDSIWGSSSPYVQYRPSVDSIPLILTQDRVKARMPSSAIKAELHKRDGYHCRFCGIPVIRKEVRVKMMKLFPNSVSWTNRNTGQHAAFQAMWAQYDHILPHARGGTNELDNMVITCAPCNFGRMNYTLDEVGIAHPDLSLPVVSSWSGLERILK